MNVKLIGAALLSCMVMTPITASAQLSIGISVRLAPPPLPVYAQPPLPGPDYLWTPGYWAWDDYVAAYYFVPGTWVRAPRPGLLWTPPWWGWIDGSYVFHTGYWGSHIGFYGGVAYGFGYTGFGYQGGYWNGGHLFYNQTVNNITNVHVTNVYQTNVTEVTNRISHVSYNGGPGGVRAQPRPEEQLAAGEQRIASTAHQQDHVEAARADPRAFASANRGHPPVTATSRALGTQGVGMAAYRPGAAPAHGGMSDQRHQLASGGITPAGVPAFPGAPQALRVDGNHSERFSGGPDHGGGYPRFDASRSAELNRHADGGRGTHAESMAFDPLPPVASPRQGHNGNPFATPPHVAQPHPPKPPHAPRPPHQRPPGHRDDHHHG